MKYLIIVLSLLLLLSCKKKEQKLMDRSIFGPWKTHDIDYFVIGNENTDIERRDSIEDLYGQGIYWIQQDSSFILRRTNGDTLTGHTTAETSIFPGIITFGDTTGLQDEIPGMKIFIGVDSGNIVQVHLQREK